MTEAVSANTQAILLLTAPLIAGRAQKAADLLTPSEYKKLARRLVELNAKPADLLTPAAAALLGDCKPVLELTRAERLLARGFLLSQAIERWHARAIWVISRADAAYPQRLKLRLREDSPAVLYGCGDRTILDRGGLAVMGSRNADAALLAYAEQIGRLVASAERALVSGGARGIDQAAMRGAVDHGGRAAGVLADSLEKYALQRDHRNALLEGRLVLISSSDPNAAFNVGHAMQRNKLIYALADGALIVSAEVNKGGTWAGAIEQLDKLQLVPVFVRSSGASSKALDALTRKGATPWPEPDSADQLNAALPALAPEGASRQRQLALELPQRNAASRSDSQTPGHASEPAEELFQTVRSLVLRIVREPMTAAVIARKLRVTEPQIQKWLKRLVDSGVLEKRKKPVRYAPCQTGLFEPTEVDRPDPRDVKRRAGLRKR